MMNLKPIPEKLFDPEYYMETESKDVRLAVSKINDFIETLGDALLSLLYSNKEEYVDIEERELNIVRRNHIRHAIVDLNNSFDILLQVPWFLYRYWMGFNSKEKYSHLKDRQYSDIIRNTDGWVEKVENSCEYKYLIKVLKDSSEPKIRVLAKSFENFNNYFIFNRSKKVLIRKIANQLKHKHNIKLKEFSEPHNFNMIINGQRFNTEDKNFIPEIKVDFFDIETETIQGKIIVRYVDDLEVDIEYKSGEKFLGKNLVKPKNVYTIDEIFNEMEDYYNNIIDFYNQIYNIIKEDIHSNPFMPKPTIKESIEVNMDKFYKPSLD